MSTSVTSVVSHFPSAENGFTTTTSGSVSSGAATVGLNSVAGYSNGEIAVFVIDPTDASKKQTFTGTIDTSGVQVTSVVWTAGTNQTHALGATVVDYATATHISMMTKGILVEHNQSGTHSTALITSRTEDTDPDPDADFLLTYDTSAAALKKVKPSNLSGGLTGWTSNVLPSVSSVTYNGNRSYDVTFGSTVASYLTPGMRVRTSRTVAAPTTVFSLDGSNDYYNKTSPSGMTFTDDFTVSAWIRLTSYNVCVIASRYNGTSGWDWIVGGGGIISLRGFNAGAANFRTVSTYQSLPLNKWVHVTAFLDMSGNTYTSDSGATNNYIMFDGVVVPGYMSAGGTSPTALVQAGNLEIGSNNGGTNPFPGQLTDIMIFNARVTPTTMRGYMSQTPSGSETSLISAYKNGSTTDLNTGNANNLTAQNGATTSTSYAPYTVDANGTPGGTYDYGIVTKVATTTATIQCAEGTAIPSSGGISAVDLSAYKCPYGFPADEGRWRVETLNNANPSQATPVSGTWYNMGSIQLTIPVGAWVTDYQGTGDSTGGANGAIMYATISTGAATESDKKSTVGFFMQGSVRFLTCLTKRTDHNLSSATLHYLNAKVDAASVSAIQWNTDRGIVVLSAKPAHL